MSSDNHVDHVEQSLQRVRVWMELRALKPITIAVYLRCTRRFIAHIGKPSFRRV